MGTIFSGQGARGAQGPVGPSGITTMLSGYTIWVDQASPAATDDRTGKSNYDQAAPFLTIQAAIDVAVPNQDWVIVRAGTYAERLILPAGVSIQGTYNTFIEAPDADDLPLIEISNGCFVSYFSITVPLVNAAVLYNGLVATDVCYLDHLDFYGGGTGNCIRKQGLGLIDIVTCWLADGTVNKMLDLQSGEAQVVEFGIFKPASQADIIADVAVGSTLDLADFFCVDGLVIITAIRSGGTIRGHSTRISTAAVGIQVTSASAQITLVVILANNTVDLLVDVAAALSNVKISGQISVEKITAPLAWWSNPATSILGFDVSTQDPGTKLVGKFGVGTLSGGSEIGLGSGLPTTIGMRCFQNSNLEIGSWADITASLKDDVTVPLFLGSSVGQSLYIGADDEFWALKFNIIVPALPASGFIVADYWDGVAWVQLRIMTVDEVHPHTQRGNRIFEGTGEQYIHISQPSTAQSTVNGVLAYWIRLRVAQVIAQIPTADLCRLQGSGTHIESEGSISAFGLAESMRIIANTDMSSRIALVTFVPANASANVANGMNLNIQGNQLNNGVTDGFGGLFSVPLGFDTCRELSFGVQFFGSDSNAGNVDFQFWWIVTGAGSVYNGTAVANVVPFTIAKTALVSVAIEGAVTFNLGQSLILPGQTFWWSLRRLGGTDTYNGNVAITNLKLEGTFWRW